MTMKARLEESFIAEGRKDRRSIKRETPKRLWDLEAANVSWAQELTDARQLQQRNSSIDKCVTTSRVPLQNMKAIAPATASSQNRTKF